MAHKRFDTSPPRLLTAPSDDEYSNLPVGASFPSSADDDCSGCFIDDGTRLTIYERRRTVTTDTLFNSYELTNAQVINYCDLCAASMIHAPVELGAPIEIADILASLNYNSNKILSAIKDIARILEKRDE